MSSTSSFAGGTFPLHRLDYAVEHGPLHLRSVYKCVRDGGIAFVTVPQNVGRFDLPTDRPTLAILGDDMTSALGPAAFHRKSVRRFLMRCRTAAVIACEAIPFAYTAAALGVMSMRWDAVIVETLPEHEGTWVDLIREANPSAALLIGKVHEATA